MIFKTPADLDIQQSQEGCTSKKIISFPHSYSLDVTTEMQSVFNTAVSPETTIQQLQDHFGKLYSMVLTLPPTSYNGTFIWKIPEVQRWRREAMSRKTVCLYSAPFFTGRPGYKLSLRLYMDGDGGGKGTHLSFFLTVMKGEYDAQLTWPFRQTVMLMLLDQDNQDDIVRSFSPDSVSPSFQQPTSEMNVASGCSRFAPLSILDNPSYVKDDVMVMKCRVDMSGNYKN